MHMRIMLLACKISTDIYIYNYNTCNYIHIGIDKAIKSGQCLSSGSTESSRMKLEDLSEQQVYILCY